MGTVTISTQELLVVIGGAVSIVTAIWYAALYVGKITVRLDRHEDRLNDHAKAIKRIEVTR